ncbi:MAG: hypothetical protein HYU99_06890 [Deltaproteobacteria bacterium]|nr:hypothetical protein [Deltaproteobacteria bacterium]
MRHVKTAVLGAIVAFILGACGGATSDSATDASGDESGAENVGAAVGSIFGGEESLAALQKKERVLSRLVDLFVREAKAQAGQPTACEVIANEDDPDDVETSLSIEAGTYGMTGATVTLTAADGCDQGGEYASFSLESHSLDCEDGDGNESTLTMLDSSGVWRENVDTNVTEIYGTFSVEVEGETFSDIQCSLTITHGDEGDGEFGGDCEDSEGSVIEQAGETTCTDHS